MNQTQVGKRRGGDPALEQRIGERLRYERIVAGLTQQQLGARIGISAQQIQKYETGKNRLTISRLMALAEAMHVPMARFVGSEGAEEEHPALPGHSHEFFRVLANLRSDADRQLLLSVARRLVV